MKITKPAGPRQSGRGQPRRLAGSHTLQCLARLMLCQLRLAAEALALRHCTGTAPVGPLVGPRIAKRLETCT